MFSTSNVSAHRTRSSIYYHFTLLLAHCWNIVCTILLIGIQFTKMFLFPQKRSDMLFSVIAPFLWFVFNIIKLYLLTRGNQSENIVFLLLGLLFCIFTIILQVYFVIWQFYLWSWELPLHVISFVLDGVLFSLGFMLILIFTGKGDEKDEKMLRDIANTNNNHNNN